MQVVQCRKFCYEMAQSLTLKRVTLQTDHLSGKSLVQQFYLTRYSLKVYKICMGYITIIIYIYIGGETGLGDSDVTMCTISSELSLDSSIWFPPSSMHSPA